MFLPRRANILTIYMTAEGQSLGTDAFRGNTWPCTPSFPPDRAEARRKHSGLESTVNSLKHQELDRIRLHGRAGFELAVGLSVLALYIHRTGQLLRNREREQIKQDRRNRAVGGAYAQASRKPWRTREYRNPELESASCANSPAPE